MKNSTRLLIAIALTLVMAVGAVGVWAGSARPGTVPIVPVTGSGSCPGTVDMGTATFTPLANNCTLSVEWIGEDTGEYVDPPEGLACVSDTFEVTIDPSTVLIKVCYAYPPELAEKNATIYKLNEEASPPVWAEVPDAETTDGMICVTTTQGYVSLIGNP